jgi:hypothetical protein
MVNAKDDTNINFGQSAGGTDVRQDKNSVPDI